MTKLFEGLDAKLSPGVLMDFSGSPLTVDGFMRTCEKYGIPVKSTLLLANSTFTKEAMDEWTMSKIPPKIDIDNRSVDGNY